MQAQLARADRGSSRGAPAWALTAPAVSARAALQAVTFALLPIVASAQVEGRERIERIPGAFILAANHASHLDAPLILRSLPARVRTRVAVAAAADYFFSRPWMGAAVALWLNAFPFCRSGSARASLGYAAGLVDSGWSLLVFPEGGRSESGAIGRFKSGAGYLAAETGAPIVPVNISGTHAVLPKGRRLPRPGRVFVRFGEPLYFDGNTDYRLAASEIEAAVRALVDSGR